VVTVKKKKTSQEELHTVKIPRLPIVIGLIVLIALIIFVILHVHDERKFLDLLSTAQPEWLLLVIGFQVGTYTCVGAVWYVITWFSGYRIALLQLAKLSLEKLSIDQLIPAIGVSGNLIVYQNLKRWGLPKRLSLEAILLNILSHNIAYGMVSMASLVILWSLNKITPVLLGLFGLFALVLISVPGAILWMVSHKDKILPHWLLKFKFMIKGQRLLRTVSSRRIYSFKMLFLGTLFNLLIFLLDSGSLWATLHALDTKASYMDAFLALTVASVAATLSALPGGIGGFEAGAVTMLSVLGIRMEAALAGTIVLRGFTLWLPLLPGLWLARKEIKMRW
jgi:uncharacterized protein (TIRG00374 family)